MELARQSKPPSTACVLIADDVKDTRDLYALYFTFRGFRVIKAEDGAQALAGVADRPDIIVLDLAMPKVSGFEVLAAVKGNPETRDVPVVVLSGQGEQERALSAGADAYFEKPCLPDSLFNEVSRILRARTSRGRPGW